MLISLHDKVPFMEHAVKCVFAESLTFLNSGWFISGTTVSPVPYSYYLLLFFFFLFYFPLDVILAEQLFLSPPALWAMSVYSHLTGQEFPWPIFLAYMSFLRTSTIILLNIPMRKNNIHAPFCWSKTVELAYCCVNSFASQGIDLGHPTSNPLSSL